MLSVTVHDTHGAILLGPAERPLAACVRDIEKQLNATQYFKLLHSGREVPHDFALGEFPEVDSVSLIAEFTGAPSLTVEERMQFTTML